LKEEGFDYCSNAEIRQENFPTRVYGDYTLEEGVYDALIIELGEGVGDNWWCVIYPPLCFTSASSDVTYRWLIQDIIDKWKKNN
jgi:stage II sporulation protein R